MLQVKGKITVWKDEKGFGFIKPETGMEQVFVHISAFGNISRRPGVGDTVFYEEVIDNNGKKKATNARIEGVEQVKKPDQNKAQGSRRKKSRFSWLWYIAILIAIGAVVLHKNSSFFDKNLSVIPNNLSEFSSDKSSPANQYKCSGKIYCSEMSSYEEAKYYLDHCPNVKIDGDRDGIPCESQFGH